MVRTQNVLISGFCAILLALIGSDTTSALPAPGLFLKISIPANNLLHSVAVFGRDDRRVVPSDYEIFKKQIGILYNPKTNTLCTAFCVAPDVIATAAHCFFNRKKGRKLNISSFLFRLHKANRQSTQARIAGNEKNQSRRYIIAGTSGLNRRPPIGAAKDWALARLDRPVCQNGYIRVTSQPLDRIIEASKKYRVFQLAFHLDFKNWRLAYSKPCKVGKSFGKTSWRKIRRQFSNAEALVLHNCDTGGASSGSPIFMDTPRGPEAIAINVGTYQQRNLMIRDGHVVRKSRYKTIANTAVNSSQFVKFIDAFSHRTIINSDDDLKALQSWLKFKGYYSGQIDGVYGRRTETAIKRVERKNKLLETGLASHELLNALGVVNGRTRSTSGSQERKRPAN